MNILDKVKHQLLELVTTENLTVNFVRILFCLLPYKDVIPFHHP